MILEAENLDAVRSAINKFPMAENELLNFEIFPLKPYLGIETLFAKQ